MKYILLVLFALWIFTLEIVMISFSQLHNTVGFILFYLWPTLPLWVGIIYLIVRKKR